MASGEAVANEPRLFVGQIPAKCTEEDLWPLFSPYGTVRNLHILRGPDTKPRGCAMVLYTRWAQAEAAAEALDGTAALTGGQGRPLVVHFANPRKPPPGLPAEPGLAPRKLFVGQVPRDVTEDALKPLFAPYGEIEHINILRTQRGLSAGCGFVQFKRWSQAENAMEAHNGKTRLGSSEVPLVVKFADAKRREQQLQALSLGFKRVPGWVEANKHLGDPASDFAYQLSQQQWPMMNQGNPLLGGGIQMAVQQQMQNLMASAYPGSYPAPSQYPMGDPSMLHRSQVHDRQLLGPSDRLQGYGHMASGMHPLGSHNLPADIDPLTGQLLSDPSGGLGSSMGLPSQNTAASSSIMKKGASGSLVNLPAASNGDLVAQQLSELSIAGLNPQQNPGEASSGTAFVSQGQQQPGGLSDLAGTLSTRQPGLGSRRSDMQSAYLQSMAGAAGGLPYGGLLPGMGMPGGDQASRPWGQKINSNDKLNEWKLFIGQVPLEATEEDLWTLFSPIGQVLELYVLRNNNAKSRGCAFVTYASKHLAEQAITQLNGRQMPSGKTLVVKFADRASASKSAMGNLLKLYMQ